jgi:hypothetical protein
MANDQKPWRNKIPIPYKGINTRYSPARVSTMKAVFGSPVGKLTNDCNEDAISPKIAKRIKTRKIGKWKFRGLDLFLDVIEQVFAEYAVKYPDAYNDLHQEGMLCVRLVRGSKSQPSNHSWGTAVDLGFGDAVDSRGDGFCFKGMLDLYAIAKKYKLFWGASFSTEDAMHFEASEQLVREWSETGLI